MSHHSAHAQFTDEKRLRWALLLTSTFMVVEFLGGVISGSLALLADAGHMLADTSALTLAWLAARASGKPADKLRSYGYHRLQILAAFVNGIAFIGVVAWITVEAISRLWAPIEVRGGIMLIVAAAGLLVNLAAFAILHGRQRGNLNVQAAAVHVIGDLLGSVATILAAVIIIWTGWVPVDPLLSVLVALLILRSAWIIVRQSAHILLEGTPQDMDVELLRKTLAESVPGVRDVHHMHVWSLTPERPLLTMHVEIQPDVDQTRILQHLKRVLAERFNVHHSTIQLESEKCADH